VKTDSAAYSVLYAIVWQLAWLLVVAGAATDWHPTTTGAGFALLVVHLVAQGRGAGAQLATIGWALAIGVIADTALAATDLVAYRHDLLPAPGVPLWILLLWAMFACGLHHPLTFLRDRVGLGFPLGAVAGLLAYLGGERLGAIEIHSLAGHIAVSGVYAGGVPLLALLAGRTPAQAVSGEEGAVHHAT